MKKITVKDILFLLLSVILCVGIKFIFSACGAKEDGSFMSCHWAEQAIFANSIVLVILSVLHCIFKKYKTGIAISMGIVSVLTALIPNIFIRLCMMQEMYCRSVMRPAVMILGIAIAICAVIEILQAQKGEN